MSRMRHKVEMSGAISVSAALTMTRPLILFGSLALRTHVRRRRNHCPRCNYSLAGIAPSACPEWGNPYQYAR